MLEFREWSHVRRSNTCTAEACEAISYLQYMSAVQQCCRMSVRI